MSGLPEKISARQLRAIVAILAGKTRAEASRAAGCGESTLRRWQHEPAFREALEAARVAALDDFLTVISGAGREVAEELRRIALDPATPRTAKVLALKELAACAFRARDLLEVGERIARIERALKRRQIQTEGTQCRLVG